MPRIFNQAAWYVVQAAPSRDEAIPICQRCSKANRYCDRSPTPAQFHNRSQEDEAGTGRTKTAIPGPFPSPKDPRSALQNPSVARYFYHYITNLAPWYDLSDSLQLFGTNLPETALENPLPFAAILALSAVHISQTTAPSARAAAEFYHGHCVRLLIELKDDEDDEANTQGLALASVCLLRSYEILSEEVDPNRHLQGAYSLAAYRSPLVDYLGSGMRTAGFWNYLREDITFSLFQRCPLKIDLDQMPLPNHHHNDHSYLNTVSLILGRIINSCFASTITEQNWALLFDMLRTWSLSLPSRFRPFSREERGLGLTLPSIWMLKGCHAAALHYQLVCVTIICTQATPEKLLDLKALLGDSHGTGNTREDILESVAHDVCGIAFTANTPSVLVNSFGPIAFCAKFIRGEASQRELIRRLMGSKRSIGWPVQRLISDLQVEWSGSIPATS
nr:phytanoyl- dioxygenase [Colletotrichum truncatum]KAF6796266.1 phytanoyl- dioxygenase [Colletotrichum truncatum]